MLDKSTHEVKTPKGFKEAYAQVRRRRLAGAVAATRSTAARACRFVVNQCFYEMLNCANQAWTMYPGLSHGAYEALVAHGTEEQKKTYLPKLTSGEWTGTMCLTEPHCGTDLGLLRTKAEPQPDGSYQHHRQQDLHLGRRARHGRQHHPPGAGPPAGRAQGQQGHQPVRRAEVQRQGRRLARRAATASTAAASSTRWASTATPRRRSCSKAPPARWSASPTRAWPRCS